MASAAKLLEPDVGYGLILAEAKETIQLLTSPATFLVKQLKRLKRPRTLRPQKLSRKLQSALQYASDAWLQYRYAIMPTISDIADISEKTTKVLTPKVGFRRVGGGVQGPESYNRVCGIVGFYTCYFSRSVSTGSEIRYISHLFYDIVDYAAAERNRLGLGASQIPSLIWELVPFSFVVDWVVDVGSWLDACRPKPEYVKKGNTASLIVTSYGSTNTFAGSIYPDLQWWSPAASSYVWSETFYDRGVNVMLPELPPVNANIASFVRGLDSAALSWKPVMNTMKSILK